MDLTQGVFLDRDGYIPDKPGGKDVYWVTLWFDPEEARLTDVALAHLMTYRIRNRQTTINTEPKHQRYSHCLSLCIEAYMWDEDMVYEIAERLMDWYFANISAQNIIFNRSLIFRRRSLG
ncbi:uncharacterized protein N7529_004743 [Penicillium soppii]|jgi:hypothetical protein|uniref:uncharacterized protein n=1 Tax=Penicillium soppii TaxID=69789 RepID=UPI0025482F7E|nr:uncharacterized protein N7529_004743 [Penicillium soppii]KAJ5872390.1 hypothetical protein N7529_004743 [Penicillium soppii]